MAFEPGLPEARPSPFRVGIATRERLRREPREEAVRIVEYTRFPRRGHDRRRYTGFTRDFSASGMCLGVDVPEPVGSLLRVTLREVDGSPAHTSIGRVVWCSAERDGRFWLGLELLSDGREGAGARRRVVAMT